MKPLSKWCTTFIILLIINWQPSFTQNLLRAGITTGINFANQSFSKPLYEGDHEQLYRNGWTIGGIIELGITEQWLICFEPRYIQKGTKFQNIDYTQNNPLPAGKTDATFKLSYFEFPLLIKSRFESPTVSPFIFGGPTISINNSAKIEAPGTNVLNRPNTDVIYIKKDVNTTELSFDIGVGGEYQLFPKATLLADIRYSHGLINIYSNQKVPSANSYGFVLQIALLFDISKKATEVTIPEKRITTPTKLDTDGDGLLDTDEINTHNTNPYRADTDNDGLNDSKEIINYKTNPLNPDTDGDGLTDGDEVQIHKSNPLDPDTDHGGIKDGVEVARKTNPLDASDDIERKEEIKMDIGKAIILEGIVFETASAKITPTSLIILEKAVNTLLQNPEIVVEIHGHTDNVGKRDYNMKLSLARANSVKDYLVQRGIDANRLITKGFGFDKPIASNDTPEGRQKNRRIEFLRIK